MLLGLQSSIDERMVLSKKINQSIKRYMTTSRSSYETTTCQSVYEQLFDSPWVNNFWGKPKTLGAGAYGRVFEVKLKDFPYYPLALKKTNNLEFEETQNTIKVSSLVEVGANPHFVILYAHLHCETPKSYSLISGYEPEITTPWNIGMEQIRSLENKLQQVFTKKERAQINREIKDMEKQLIVDDETLNYFKKLKKDKEMLMEQIYGGSVSRHTHDLIYQNDLDLMSAIQDTYQKILKIRTKTHISYEFFMLEMADNSFKKWIEHQTPGNEEMLSATFQICSALITLVSFFGLVQNDLLLHNIMYNQVNPAVSYVYKIKNYYFKIPLYGKLMKIIDFGLSTDVQKFTQARGDGTLVHWCEGGRGYGPSQEKECAGYVRDILEFFYWLNYYQHLWSPELGAWIGYAYQQAKMTVENRLLTAVNLFLEIFNPKIIDNFDLPSRVIQRKNSIIEVDVEFQKNIFYIDNFTMYKKKLTRSIQEKISQF